MTSIDSHNFLLNNDTNSINHYHADLLEILRYSLPRDEYLGAYGMCR
jgi:hypothetical protein